MASANKPRKNMDAAGNVFYVPPQARWSYIQSRAKLITIGRDVGDAMDTIEKDNPSLKGVLLKEDAQGKAGQAVPRRFDRFNWYNCTRRQRIKM